MIKGQYFCTVDDKSRVTVPSKLREVILEKFNNNFVLTRLEGCLILVSEDRWQIIEEENANRSFSEETTRNFQRFFVSPATGCSLDATGRLLIPLLFREYAEIKKDVVIVGVAHYIEIWSKERFVEGMRKMDKELSGYSEHLHNFWT